MKISTTRRLVATIVLGVGALSMSGLASAQISVYADEGQPTIEPAVADPFDPQPGAVIGEPVMKAFGGSQWSFIGFKPDQTLVEAIYLSGTIATGTTNPRCPIIPNWVITAKRDGVTLVTYASNAFNIVDNANHCGLHFTFRHTSFEILGPGTYEFRVSQPAYGSDLVKTAALNACNAGAVLPMYAARHDVYTDNFYTTLYSDSQAAISYGYYNTGVPFKVSKSNPVSSPWKRFFKGAPQIEHFYSYTDVDANLVLSYGWVYERVEGNVFSSQRLGTLPLTRLNKWNGATSDLQHVYTLNAAEVPAYLAQGWTSDGVVGYACP